MKPSPWIRVYGWYLIAAGLVSFVLPWSMVFGHSRYSHVYATIRIIVVFAAGMAVLRRKGIALALVWINVALIGFDVLSRRLGARNIVVLLISLSLAVWYTTAIKLTERDRLSNLVSK